MRHLSGRAQLASPDARLNDEAIREARKAESLDDEDASLGRELADEGLSPLALLEQAADALAIRDCLASIDGPQRQCLALAYYQGLSHSEVAQTLGSPIGSVKVWLLRGLERLKRCLDRQE